MHQYTADRELELCRQEYNAAGRRVMEARQALDAAYEELVAAAKRLGQADEAVRHGGYA